MAQGDGDEDEAVTGTVEVGAVVRDLEAMTRFYLDTLGFKHASDTHIPGGLLRKLTFGSGMLKLLAFDTAPPTTNPPGGMAGATGLRYITIYVDDLAATVTDCQAAGAPVPVPPAEFMPGELVAIVEDPEGNWIEVVQPPC